MQRRETPGRQRVTHSVRHPASPPCANAVDKRQCELQVSEKVTENPPGVNLEGYEKGWGFRLRGWSGSRRARTRPLPVLRGVGLYEYRAPLFKDRLAAGLPAMRAVRQVLFHLSRPAIGCLSGPRARLRRKT